MLNMDLLMVAGTGLYAGVAPRWQISSVVAVVTVEFRTFSSDALDVRCTSV